jgi:arsenate reductase
MSDKKRVLVLCTGNSCRSQMAEGWIRHDLGGRVEVFSAGTHPCFVHPLAVRVMAESGVDLSNHRSKSVSEFAGRPFDLVVTVCDSARDACPRFPGAVRTIHEPIPDPVAFVGLETETLEEFRKARDLIRATLVPLVKRTLHI